MAESPRVDRGYIDDTELECSGTVLLTCCKDDPAGAEETIAEDRVRTRNLPHRAHGGSPKASQAKVRCLGMLCSLDVLHG